MLFLILQAQKRYGVIHVKDNRNLLPFTVGVLAVAIVLMLFNSAQLLAVSSTGVTRASSGVTLATGVEMPTGTPEVYGKELDVSYDGVSASNPQLADATIARMGQLDRSIQLDGDLLKRYINILYTMHGGISCEYCCGARSVIFSNGQPACGCAHSYAMRGLTKYLLTQHGDQYTDAQILEEVGKWKMLFFPTQLTQKAQIMESQGVDTNIISLTTNENRGIEKGVAGGGMVGGC